VENRGVGPATDVRIELRKGVDAKNTICSAEADPPQGWEKEYGKGDENNVIIFKTAEFKKDSKATFKIRVNAFNNKNGIVKEINLSYGDNHTPGTSPLILYSLGPVPTFLGFAVLDGSQYEEAHVYAKEATLAIPSNSFAGVANFYIQRIDPSFLEPKPKSREEYLASNIYHVYFETIFDLSNRPLLKIKYRSGFDPESLNVYYFDEGLSEWQAILEDRHLDLSTRTIQVKVPLAGLFAVFGTHIVSRGYNTYWLILTAISLLLTGGYLILRRRRKLA
jgi:LPXTG-motif cell wall-anchored protein